MSSILVFQSDNSFSSFKFFRNNTVCVCVCARMRVHAHVLVHICVCNMCVECTQLWTLTKTTGIEGLLPFSTLFFWGKFSLLEPGSSPSNPPVSAPRVKITDAHKTMLSLLYGSWDLHSGSHTCAARALKPGAISTASLIMSFIYSSCFTFIVCSRALMHASFPLWCGLA